MEWQTVTRRWPKYRVLAQTQWPELSDSDLAIIQGRRAELEAHLQLRYGKSREQAALDVSRWFGRWQSGDNLRYLP